MENRKLNIRLTIEDMGLPEDDPERSKSSSVNITTDQPKYHADYFGKFIMAINNIIASERQKHEAYQRDNPNKPREKEQK